MTIEVELDGLERQIDKACAELKQLRAREQELTTALREAIRLIRVWHGMGMGAAEAQAWELYQASPEMQRLNFALVAGRAD